MAIFLLFFSRVFALDQLKTTDTLVTTSSSALSAASSTTITLYIGDNLSGISNPVKSIFLTVSGVYTGGGTLALGLNGNSATTKTFTLPSVAAPTPFELIYKDPANTINPTSAGSYTYTLNITPSGIIIYDFGASMSETHRYTPPTCPDGSSANQKLKTTDTLVTTSSSALSAASSTTITLYIGDNLSGISNPVKSIFLTVSGVYTGGGTLALGLNGNSATTKTFTLPSVAAPTPFELIYKDPANTINPTSAGSYTYTLNITPSGIIIYDFGASMSETHRYQPPSCGGGYAISGQLTSAIFDTTGTSTGAAYNAFLWKGVMGIGQGPGKVRFQLATSDSTSGPWSFYGGTTCAVGDWFDPGGPNIPIEIKGSNCITQFNNKRYFRYQVQICSLDCVSAGNSTPRVDDLIVNWAP